MNKISGENVLLKQEGTVEYRKALRLLKQAARVIQNIPIDMQCLPTSYYDAWCVRFWEILRGRDRG